MEHPLQADFVLIGKIYTGNAGNEFCEALAIKSGVICFVGTELQAQSYLANESTQLIRRNGLFLPGFFDSHVHAITGSIQEMQCALYRETSLTSALQKVRQYALDHPTLPVILGAGWHVSWEELHNGIPFASDLDRVVPDRPVILRRSDGHATWVNSKAMEGVNMTREMACKYADGLVPQDEDGNALGCFHEESEELFLKYFQNVPLEQREEALLLAAKLFAESGIIGWHDALVRGGNLTTYRKYAPTLDQKINLALWWDPKKGLDQIGEFEKLKEKRSNMDVRTIKIMLDGVMESKTALLHSPYGSCRCGHDGDDDPHNSAPEETNHCGNSQFGAELKEVFQVCDARGFQLHIHAVGDKAVTDALDALEWTRERNGPSKNRHQIAHLQVVQPNDISRFVELDVITNYQPLWCEGVKISPDSLFEPMLGDRIHLQYPIKTTIESGVRYCFGSDWHVSDYEPLLGIHVAVNHKLERDEADWMPEQCISLRQAIYGYTLGAAYAQFREAETGSFEIGKAADIVLLDEDLFTIDPLKIKDVKVQMTMVDGKIIYERK